MGQLGRIGRVVGQVHRVWNVDRPLAPTPVYTFSISSNVRTVFSAGGSIDVIAASQSPPKWGACGGMVFHSQPSAARWCLSCHLRCGLRHLVDGVRFIG